MDSKIIAASKQAAQDLAKNGYAVVPSILSVAECEAMMDEAWVDIERISAGALHPIKRDNVETQYGKDKADNPRFFPELSPGLVGEPSVLSHLPSVWRARKAAAPYFAALFGTGALITSTDRINIQPGYEERAREPPFEKRPPLHNLHADQSPLLNGLHSIQSYVDLRGSDGDKDASLIVIEGTHLVHHELLFKKWGITESKDWYRFKDAAQMAYIQKHFKTVRVACPPGSLVLWDSRTFHQGGLMRPGGHARFVVYVSMQPRSCVPASVLEKKLAWRRKQFKERRCTSHVPLSRQVVFGKHIWLRGKQAGPYLETLTAEQDAEIDNDPVIQSLVGIREAPAIDYEGPSLLPPMIDPELMVANKTKLLHALGVRPSKKRSRKESFGSDGNDSDVEYNHKKHRAF